MQVVVIMGVAMFLPSIMCIRAAPSDIWEASASEHDDDVDSCAPPMETPSQAGRAKSCEMLAYIRISRSAHSNDQSEHVRPLLSGRSAFSAGVLICTLVFRPNM